MPLSAPPKLSVPFNASGVNRNTIPVASQIGITPGLASYTDGFVPLNMTPVSAGGIPPFGQDMNGILYAITNALQWQQATTGGFSYDSTFQTAIGGYPIGSIVQRSDGTGFWLNTVANNLTAPETGGAGWQTMDAGITQVTMTNANVTLTALQASRSIIIITGVLTANLNLILPTYSKQWLVVNNCTGAFTVTAKTASGSGFAIATSASQAVYGDGTNIVAYAQATGRLLRTTVYINTAGVLQSSVDGSAFANASSTFTPIAGAVSAGIEALSAGGGGGNAAATTAGQISAGCGGGGGGYAAKRVLIASISGVTISVGAGGAAGTAGGSTAVGGIVSVTGGGGGQLGPASSVTNLPFGIAGGGIGTGGDINARGQQGGYGIYSSTPQQGYGGGSQFGFGPQANGGAPTTGTVGTAAESYGSGGSGAANGASVPGNTLGGAGKSGLVIVREYS